MVGLEGTVWIVEPSSGWVGWDWKGPYGSQSHQMVGLERVLIDHGGIEWLGWVGRDLTDHRVIEWLGWKGLHRS